MDEWPSGQWSIATGQLDVPHAGSRTWGKGSQPERATILVSVSVAELVQLAVRAVRGVLAALAGLVCAIWTGRVGLVGGGRQLAAEQRDERGKGELRENINREKRGHKLDMATASVMLRIVGGWSRRH